jgi:hypothetical protein
MGLLRGERSLLPQSLTTDIRGDSATSSTRTRFSVHAGAKAANDLAAFIARRPVSCREQDLAQRHLVRHGRGNFQNLVKQVFLHDHTASTSDVDGFLRRARYDIFVLTPNWFKAKWRFVDLYQARAFGKVICRSSASPCCPASRR